MLHVYTECVGANFFQSLQRRWNTSGSPAATWLIFDQRPLALHYDVYTFQTLLYSFGTSRATPQEMCFFARTHRRRIIKRSICTVRCRHDCMHNYMTPDARMYSSLNIRSGVWRTKVYHYRTLETSTIKPVLLSSHAQVITMHTIFSAFRASLLARMYACTRVAYLVLSMTDSACNVPLS